MTSTQSPMKEWTVSQVQQWIKSISSNISPACTTKVVHACASNNITGIKLKQYKISKMQDFATTFDISPAVAKIYCAKIRKKKLEDIGKKTNTLVNINATNNGILNVVLYDHSQQKRHDITIHEDWRPTDVCFKHKSLLPKISFCSKCNGFDPSTIVRVDGRKWHMDQTAQQFGIRNHEFIVIRKDLSSGGGIGEAHQFSDRVCFTSADYNHTINIPSFHVSCRSDKIDGKSNMVGIVLYQYNGKTDWRLNGIHCRTGYIYIKKSDNIKHISTVMGTYHSKCYKSLFGVDYENVVGGGFAFQGGKWKYNSGTFNKPGNDEWHNNSKVMHELEEKWIQRAVNAWKQGKQNVIVSEFECVDFHGAR